MSTIVANETSNPAEVENKLAAGRTFSFQSTRNEGTDTSFPSTQTFIAFTFRDNNSFLSRLLLSSFFFLPRESHRQCDSFKARRIISILPLSASIEGTRSGIRCILMRGTIKCASGCILRSPARGCNCVRSETVTSAFIYCVEIGCNSIVN